MTEASQFHCKGCGGAIHGCEDPNNLCLECIRLRERDAMTAIEAKLEDEGMAAEFPALSTQAGLTELGRAMPPPTFGGWAPEPAPGPLPIDDLRERIAILTAAGVTHYRDAGVELHIDLEARTRNPPNTKKVEF